MRILAVDDNPINLKLIGDVLEFEGHTVARARDANEALTQITNARPDLVLLDIAMPGMDGLTLTRKLKAEEATRDLRIFIVTASAMKGDADRALAAGCDDYIPKPIDIKSLLEKVEALESKS